MRSKPSKPARKSDKDWVSDEPTKCPKCGATVFHYSAYVLGNYGRDLEYEVNPDGSTHVCEGGNNA